MEITISNLSITPPLKEEGLVYMTTFVFLSTGYSNKHLQYLSFSLVVLMFEKCFQPQSILTNSHTLIGEISCVVLN